MSDTQFQTLQAYSDDGKLTACYFEGTPLALKQLIEIQQSLAPAAASITVPLEDENVALRYKFHDMPPLFITRTYVVPQDKAGVYFQLHVDELELYSDGPLCMEAYDKTHLYQGVQFWGEPYDLSCLLYIQTELVRAGGRINIPQGAGSVIRNYADKHITIIRTGTLKHLVTQAVEPKVKK